jgi:FtsZ-interacting cell division protein ZipA
LLSAILQIRLNHSFLSTNHIKAKTNMMYHSFLQDTIEFNPSLTVSILVGIVAIVGAVYRGLRWFNQQNEKRASAVRVELEAKAKEVKEIADARAKDVKETAEANAAQIERALNDRAKDVKTELTNTTQLLKDKINGIELIVASLSTVVKDNFNELRTRADLTNGNVAHIRNDMTDLAADIQELFETIDPHADTQGAIRVSRDKEVRRRERKRQIESDRVEQMHPDERR